MSSLNGVLPIDKPAGPTSHDVVALTRKALRTREVGHTGTLDPFATGLLLLCIGAATRIAEYLLGLPKSYSARVRLGVRTDTDDLEGNVIEENEGWVGLSPQAVEDAIARQRGEVLQTPPRYSAKKVEGVRAHVLARRGDEVPTVPVPVTIDRIEMTRFAPPELDLEIDCSSGTYVRSIARDIGDDLGVGAHVIALRRTRIGRFSVEDAISVEQLQDRAAVEDALVTPLEALAHLPRLLVSAEERAMLAHGRRIPLPVSALGGSGGPIAVHDAEGGLVAIGEARGDQFQPRKVFA